VRELYLWGANEPNFDVDISELLESQFGVAPDIAAGLRCVEKGGRLAGRSVRLIRVFDPVAVTGVVDPVLSYHDFDQLQKALLFEGYTETIDGTWFGQLERHIALTAEKLPG